MPEYEQYLARPKTGNGCPSALRPARATGALGFPPSSNSAQRRRPKRFGIRLAGESSDRGRITRSDPPLESSFATGLTAPNGKNKRVRPAISADGRLSIVEKERTAMGLRTSVFVDGANFFYMQKDRLHWWIDPKKLLAWIR